MRKVLIGALALGLVVVGGGLWLVRRTGGPMAPAEGEVPLFKADAQGKGMLIQLDAREPLRAVRWLPPMAGGHALCQVGTQSDRQLLALFQEGNPVSLFALPRPEGISEGTFRQLEVRDALWVRDTLVLLLKADGGRRELPLVLALDRKGALLWSHRAAAEHLAGVDQALWAWGPSSAQRLPLTTTKVLPAAVVWPEEVASPEALLPVGEGFLVAHGKGLSAWRPEGGWAHTAAPAPSPLGFTGSKGVLLRLGSTLYWQPEPGSLLKVSSTAQILGSESLPAPEGFDRDQALLRLLGRDPEGRLWFGLAAPLLPEAPLQAPPAATAAAAPAEEGWKEEAAPGPTAMGGTALTPEVRAAFEAHLKGPMDRLYAWKPGEAGLRRTAWTQVWPGLGAPMGLQPPPGDGALRPEAGGFLFGSDQQRWWLPLGALK